MNQQNQNQPNFTEVSGGGNFFKPQATHENGYAYNPNDYARNVLEGYLKGSRELSTQYGVAIVWDIHKYDRNTGTLGEVMSVFQDTFLQGCLQKIKVNSFVHVEYRGRVRKKNVPAHHAIEKTNSYHSWMVGVADNMPPYAEMLRAAGLAAPATASVPQQQQQQRAPQPQAQQFNPPPPPASNQGQQQWQGQPQQGQPQQQQGYVQHNQQQGQPPAAPQTPPTWNPPPMTPAPTAPPSTQGQGQWAPPPPTQTAGAPQPQFNAPATNQGHQQQWNQNDDPPF